MRKLLLGLPFIYLLITSTPVFAQTPFDRFESQAALSAVSPIPAATQLAQITATALLIVAILGLLSAITIATLRRLRWMSPEHGLRLARAARVLFGALVLFATTIPYLTLNFPPTISAPTILAAFFALSTVLWLQNQPHQNHEVILD